jgi:hypothetical protein
MNPTLIKIELALEELNVIMSALGNLPFVQVSPLIEKIREQAVPQLPVPSPREEKVES